MNKRTMLIGAVLLCILSLASLGYANTIKVGYAVEVVPATDHLTYGSDPTLTQDRYVIDIPQEYGKIIATYADPGGTVFWFEAGDGQVRNLLITETVKGPVVIHRSGKLD